MSIKQKTYKNSIFRRHKKIFLLLSFSFFSLFLSAQKEIPGVQYIRPDSTGTIPFPLDTLQGDTLIMPSDTQRVASDTSAQADVIDAPIKYNARDSLVMDMEKQKAYLFGDAEVDYKDITLNASYIEIDFQKSEIYAKGLPDSVGKITGKPVFSQGSEKFESESMRYNFKSKKGYIQGVVTEQEGGFLHSSITKRQDNGVYDIKGAKYTTCDAPHPHYYVALTKAEVIPGKEIISGPAYMVVADVPIPVAIPFGFFPMKKTHASGILIPQYGEERNRGFFLRNGGYYFALNDYFDLSITGDIYTNGTWGVRLGSNYRKRYKYSGNFGLVYFKNVSGSLDVGDYVAKSDYSIRWSYSQDAKANPTSSFRASVNLSSSSYDKRHSYNAQDYLTNTKQSSISYSKRWPGSPFNFTGSLTHSQNSQTKAVDLNLPKLSLNMNRIYPFRGKRSSSQHWYDNIDVTYNALLENRIKTLDTLLFTSEVFDDMSNGFKQTIPIGVNFKPFNNFNITPRIRYTGILYTKNIEKHYEYAYDTSNNVISTLVTDTIKKLQYAQSLLPSISLTLNPKIYGMFVFKNPDAKIMAVRHVMTPAVSFSYIPDMNSFMPDYYRTITDTTTGRDHRYSIYEKEIYGTPSLPGRSGVVNFSLNNNVEMKVRTENDTTGNNVRKIKLLESLSFSTNYNIFKDSLRWAPLTFSGRTSIWKNNVQLTFGGVLNPYAIDSVGRIINTPNIQVSHSLFRATNMNLALNLHFQGGKKKPSATGGEQRNMGTPGDMMGMEQAGGPLARNMAAEPSGGDYDYFNIPWDIRIRYNINYSKPAYTASIVQTLNVSGSFSLTPKWKISGNTGWDFKLNKLTYTSLNIHRDLHCWEMSISWIPIGFHQSYSFVINIKSSILKDLKYQKQKGFYDRGNF